MHIHRVAHVVDGVPDNVLDPDYDKMFDYGDGHWWGDAAGDGELFGVAAMGVNDGNGVLRNGMADHYGNGVGVGEYYGGLDV